MTTISSSSPASSPVLAEEPSAELQVDSVQYTVKQDDTLSKIMAEHGMSYPADYEAFLELNPEFRGRNPDLIYPNETFNFPAESSGVEDADGTDGTDGTQGSDATDGVEEEGQGTEGSGSDPVGNEGEAPRYDPRAIDDALGDYEATIDGDDPGVSDNLDPDRTEARDALDRLSDVVRTSTRGLIEDSVGQAGSTAFTHEEAVANAEESVAELRERYKDNPEVLAMIDAEVAEFARDDAFVRLRDAQAAYDAALNQDPPATEAELNALADAVTAAQEDFDAAVQNELDATANVSETAGQNVDNQAQAVREQTERMAEELEASGADPELVQQVREEGEARAQEIEQGEASGVVPVDGGGGGGGGGGGRMIYV